MLPIAEIEHFMPGRMRVKVRDRRGDLTYFRSVIEKLSKHPEIAGLRANPTTGSIVIQHEADVSSIREIANKSELFSLQEAALPKRRSASTAPSGRVSDIGLGALKAGGPALGMMGLAAFQAMRGNALGPATENFWNAYGGWRILHSPFIAFAFCGLGILQVARGRWAGSASSLLFYAFVANRLAGEPAIQSRPIGPANSSGQ